MSSKMDEVFTVPPRDTGVDLDKVPGISMRVLFVGKDCAGSEAFLGVLAMFGIEVTVAQTVSRARRILKEEGDSFDSVLLDLKLPDGRGEDLLPQIESLSQQPGLVILSDFLDELRPEAISCRTVLVPKTIAPPALAAILRGVVRGHVHTTFSRFAEHFKLSPRESKVLDRVVSGDTPKRIALDSGCSIQAVYAHLAKASTKTGCTCYQEVLAKLFRFSCHQPGTGSSNLEAK